MSTLNKQQTALLLSQGSEGDQQFWLAVGYIDEVVDQHAALLAAATTEGNTMQITLPDEVVEEIGDRPRRPVKPS